MDDERMKQRGVSQYFEELLSRIRDLRSSELQKYFCVSEGKRQNWPKNGIFA